jgi:hypothetical protein
MTHNLSIDQVQPGWKVFLGADDLGEVAAVEDGEILVRYGRIRPDAFRIPTSLVAEADDGIVDLKADQETLDQVRAARGDERDSALAGSGRATGSRREYRRPGRDPNEPLDLR